MGNIKIHLILVDSMLAKLNAASAAAWNHVNNRNDAWHAFGIASKECLKDMSKSCM